MNSVIRLLEASEWYEASQRVHSLAQRLVKQKKLTEAGDILVESIGLLLQKDQMTICLDLFDRLLTVGSREHLLRVVGQWPLDTEHGDQMVRKLFKKHNDEQWHYLIATQYYRHGMYYDAELHFYYTSLQHVARFAEMIQEYIPVDESVVTRAVLGLLCLGKPDHALQILESLKSLEHLEHYKFSWLAAQALYKRQFQIFNQVLSHYQPILREDYLHQLIECVQAVYFDFGPRKKQINPMQQMLQSLMQPKQPQIDYD
ncbi:hypothetical protein EDD86DRAFT_272389 [Gorgonomyces haynaldii]|nr:hypothetical protein EDD86DRAFT_272389 [Gorgonomyces haynaldii]